MTQAMQVRQPDDDTLRSCDVCFRSEVADIIDGDPSAELIPMRLDGDGLWLCPKCDEKGGAK